MSKIYSYFIFILFLLVNLKSAWADDGLIIHGAEIGIGKFHRHDNKVHPHADGNIWKNYVLADDAGTNTPIIPNSFLNYF